MSTKDFREQAARCRRLAYTLSDPADYLRLIEMAEELERKAQAADIPDIPLHLPVRDRR